MDANAESKSDNHAINGVTIKQENTDDDKNQIQKIKLENNTDGINESGTILKKELQQKLNSDSDSDSEDSSSDLELDIQEITGKAADFESDEETESNKPVPRTKNELVELPPVEPFEGTIDSKHKIEKIGRVSHYIGTSLVIRSDQGSTVDIESVLCLEDRKYVGRVEDVIGPVAAPFYVVRFNTEAEAKSFEKGIDIYYVADLSQIVRVPDIMTKGSDASTCNDEEPGPDELEFSDDEEEQKYKQQRKAQKDQDKVGDGAPPKQKKRKTPQQTTPSTQNNQHSYAPPLHQQQPQQNANYPPYGYFPQPTGYPVPVNQMHPYVPPTAYQAPPGYQNYPPQPPPYAMQPYSYNTYQHYPIQQQQYQQMPPNTFQNNTLAPKQNTPAPTDIPSEFFNLPPVNPP